MEYFKDHKHRPFYGGVLSIARIALVFTVVVSLSNPLTQSHGYVLDL